jgi:hypothetical protein
MKPVDIVGRKLGTSHGKCAWAFLGVFTSVRKAVAACSTKKDFVGPVRLDELAGKIGCEVSWPKGFYPVKNQNARDGYCKACGKSLRMLDVLDTCWYCHYPVYKSMRNKNGEKRKK